MRPIYYYVVNLIEYNDLLADEQNIAVYSIELNTPVLELDFNIQRSELSSVAVHDKIKSKFGIRDNDYAIDEL